MDKMYTLTEQELKELRELHAAFTSRHKQSCENRPMPWHLEDETILKKTQTILFSAK